MRLIPVTPMDNAMILVSYTTVAAGMVILAVTVRLVFEFIIFLNESIQEYSYKLICT